MIRFKCGGCGAGMEAPQSLVGRVERCPLCGSPNRVPIPSPRVVPVLLPLVADCLRARIDYTRSTLGPTRRRKKWAGRWARRGRHGLNAACSCKTLAPFGANEEKPNANHDYTDVDGVVPAGV